MVADALDCCAPAPPGFVWLSLSALRWDDFAAESQAPLWSALARIQACVAGTSPGHFVVAGWLEEVRVWTTKVLADSGLSLGGLHSQYNLGPDFSLLRFATSGAAVWFKAVGCKCAQEFAVTRILADARIPHTARVLAFCEEWRAWLSVEAEGRHPDERTSAEQWAMAARCLSDLQIASIPCTPALLAAGGRDFRIGCLRRAIEPCLNRMADLVSRQNSVALSRPGPEGFLTIETALRHACARLDTAEIPDTAGHSDLSAGNILIAENGTVFLDWAECHVGPPFLTLAYLELLTGAAGCSMQAREAYLRRWRQELLPNAVEALLASAPLLAVFACVLLCDSPNQAPEALDSGRARRLRSLTRRMLVEAQAYLHCGGQQPCVVRFTTL
ncbi:MAG: phosphotransferase family protein [Acidobacteriota bacterium]